MDSNSLPRRDGLYFNRYQSITAAEIQLLQKIFRNMVCTASENIACHTKAAFLTVFFSRNYLLPAVEVLVGVGKPGSATEEKLLVSFSHHVQTASRLSVYSQ